MTQKTCPDCGVAPGAHHTDNCDVARCLATGLQRLGCSESHDCGLDIWTGRWPGEEECEEFGWMLGKDLPDLNRLLMEATWDPSLKRWVR